jgi:hypothetical protein
MLWVLCLLPQSGLQFSLCVVHEGGVLGRRVNPDRGDPNGAARRAEDEGGDGAPGGARDRLHRGPYPLDGDQPRTARRAVSGGQVRPGT